MRPPRWLLPAAVALATLACGSPNPAAPALRPAIERVSPARAAVGDTVTITGSGFLASGNAVKIGGGGYLLDIPSADRNTLQFAVPSYLGVCPPGTAVCIQVALQLTPGDYQIAVVNERGTSNTASFQVVKN